MQISYLVKTDKILPLFLPHPKFEEQAGGAAVVPTPGLELQLLPRPASTYHHSFCFPQLPLLPPPFLPFAALPGAPLWLGSGSTCYLQLQSSHSGTGTSGPSSGAGAEATTATTATVRLR